MLEVNLDDIDDNIIYDVFYGDSGLPIVVSGNTHSKI